MLNLMLCFYKELCLFVYCFNYEIPCLFVSLWFFYELCLWVFYCCFFMRKYARLYFFKFYLRRTMYVCLLFLLRTMFVRLMCFYEKNMLVHMLVGGCV